MITIKQALIDALAHIACRVHNTIRGVSYKNCDCPECEVMRQGDAALDAQDRAEEATHAFYDKERES